MTPSLLIMRFQLSTDNFTSPVDENEIETIATNLTQLLDLMHGQEDGISILSEYIIQLLRQGIPQSISFLMFVFDDTAKHIGKIKNPFFRVVKM